MNLHCPLLTTSKWRINGLMISEGLEEDHTPYLNEMHNQSSCSNHQNCKSLLIARFDLPSKTKSRHSILLNIIPYFRLIHETRALKNATFVFIEISPIY